MRELLTGLAIVLIVALTTALVAPYLIDWNGQRDFIEARLTQALGQKVTIGGAIDVKLLPTPYLVLGQTVIGGDDAPVRLSIHHLDLELSATPLLHGEIDVTQARLVEPTIRVTLAPDRTLPALPDAPAFHADVSLDHIAVTDGTLAIADPLSGRTFALQNLDVEADAASLSGPFKVAGTEGPAGHPTSFRLSTAAAHDGRAHVRLVVAGNADHAGLDLDGTLALSAAGRSSVRQSFDGRVIVTGKLDESAGAPVAWTLTGPLQADPRTATLDGGELRLGGEDKGLTLAASGTADLGETSHIDLDLSAKTLDLDRLSDAPADAGKPPPPPQLPPLATLERAILAATPPLPATVVAKVDTATWAGETLSGLSAHIGVGGTGVQPFALEGDGPGGTHLKVDGSLAPAGFKGRIGLSAENPSRAAAWLARIDPASPLKARDLPARALSVDADVTVGDGQVDARTIALVVGPSRLAGSAHLDTSDTPAKLTAALTSPALALDTLPDIAAWRRPGSGLDLDLHLDARTLQVAQAGQGQLATGPVRLALSKTGRHYALTSFSAENLGGAKIAAQGTLDPRAAHLTLDVDAAKLEAAARLAQQVAAGDLADAFAARAPALAPARLRLDADWAATGSGSGSSGALAPTRASLDGTLGKTDLHASLAPGEATQNNVSLNAAVTAPEGTALLRQLGLATLPTDELGASKITLEAHGAAARPLDTSLRASFGATTLEVDGQFNLLAAPRGGSGALTFTSPDISPLLRTSALAFPDMLGRLRAKATGALAYGTAGLGLTDVAAEIAGTRATGTLRLASATNDAPEMTGALKLDKASLASLAALVLGPEQPAAPGSRWSNLAFGSGLADPPRTALQIDAALLNLADGLTATDASFDLGVAPGQVTLKSIAAALDGGRLTGSATLRRDGERAGLEATLGLDGVALDLPAAKGRLAGKLDLAGSGTTPLELVSSLAGSGEATFADLAIGGADPTALPKIFAEVEGDELAVDADAVARAYADAATAPLAAGTRSFDASLAGGTLALSPRAPAATSSAKVASTIDATLDLRQPSLTLRVKEILGTLPKGWTGAPPSLVVAWSGPPRAPTRSIEVSAFINAVAARALARESARIEVYEQDIRERSFFNVRLQTERRRAQDKAKAEADAREKARREAAAKEKAAQEKAAQDKAAQDKAAQDKAEQDKAARDQAEQELRSPAEQPAARPDARAQESAPRFAPQQPGATSDPSASGRY